MEEISDTIDAPRRSDLARRTLLKGAAWSVPAVMVVGVTPAFAASLPLSALTGGQLSFTRGQTDGAYTWAVTNPNSVEIQITTISITGVTPNTITIVSPTTNNRTIAAGANATGLTFSASGLTANSSDMADFTITVNFSSTADARTGSTAWTVITPNRNPNGSHTFTLNGSAYS